MIRGFLALVLLVALGACCKDGDLKPYPDTCRRYLKCVNGTYVVITCPFLKRYFDAVSGTCVYWKARCGDAECVEEAIKELPGCRDYQVCVQGRLQTRHCGGMMKYDPVRRQCRDMYVCPLGPEVTTSPPWPMTTAPPETTPKKPKETTAPPETTPKKPEVTTSPLPKTTAPPETTPKKPEVTTSPLPKTTAPPETTPKKPEVTTSPLPKTTAPPETTPKKPEVTTSPLPKTTAPPETTPKKPEVTTSPLPKTTALPETTPKKPEVTTSPLPKTTAPPETTPKKPEVTTSPLPKTTAPPETTPKKPEVTTSPLPKTTAPPETTPKKPEVTTSPLPKTTAPPETTPKKPEVTTSPLPKTTAPPETTPKKPEVTTSPLPKTTAPPETTPKTPEGTTNTPPKTTAPPQTTPAAPTCVEGTKRFVNCYHYMVCDNNSWKTEECTLWRKFDRLRLSRLCRFHANVADTASGRDWNATKSDGWARSSELEKLILGHGPSATGVTRLNHLQGASVHAPLGQPDREQGGDVPRRSRCAGYKTEFTDLNGFLMFNDLRAFQYCPQYVSTTLKMAGTNELGTRDDNIPFLIIEKTILYLD
ncbi:hypothetical protein AAG570_007393 [Ranatra chinensis]|uniref:Chitin-binding type-2 domain-containing protein n=1 Tax=Ranatra chinensis TaxID=642074 RepID=A0ABD0YAW4_9HEMI